jgi:ATP-dependent Clp protease ATP-binding subunit ClpA
MFERFTTGAREAVSGAIAQAQELRQSPIGTEHLLLALLADPGGPVALALRDTEVDERYVRAEIIRRTTAGTAPATSFLEADAEDTAALKAIGIDLDAVRQAIEANFGPDELRPQPEAPKSRLFGLGRAPLSARAKKTLELALREAVNNKNNFIAREHLMLGILRENKGLAAQILSEAGVDFGRLRTDLTRSLRDKAA